MTLDIMMNENGSELRFVSRMNLPRDKNPQYQKGSWA